MPQPRSTEREESGSEKEGAGRKKKYEFKLNTRKASQTKTENLNGTTVTDWRTRAQRCPFPTLDCARGPVSLNRARGMSDEATVSLSCATKRVGPRFVRPAHGAPFEKIHQPMVESGHGPRADAFTPVSCH
jgi:hypothetical protein